MRVSLPSLQTLLRSNVAEIKFTRRLPKRGSPPTRRMLCTCCIALLNSSQGRITLNFRPAYGKLAYNPTQKNLIVVWDILMQDYRMINMSACDLFATIPQNGFWSFFNKKLATMTTKQKIDFMNQ